MGSHLRSLRCRLSVPRRLCRPLLDPFDQEAGPHAGCPLWYVVLGLVAARGPGDVDVDPRHAAHEVAEEEGGVDRPTPARADVLDIGDVAVDLLAQVVEERQLPNPLAGGRRRSGDLAGEGVGTGEEAGHLL